MMGLMVPTLIYLHCIVRRRTIDISQFRKFEKTAPDERERRRQRQRQREEGKYVYASGKLLVWIVVVSIHRMCTVLRPIRPCHYIAFDVLKYVVCPSNQFFTLSHACIQLICHTFRIRSYAKPSHILRTEHTCCASVYSCAKYQWIWSHVNRVRCMGGGWGMWAANMDYKWMMLHVAWQVTSAPRNRISMKAHRFASDRCRNKNAEMTWAAKMITKDCADRIHHRPWQTLSN